MKSDPHRVWPFFLFTLGWTWAAQWPAVLLADVEALQGLAGLGVFGPLIAAIVLARRQGRAGELLASLRSWPAPAGWYVFALLLSGILLVLGLAATAPFLGDRPWIYLPNTAPAVVALFVVSLSEEVGWRGYALPRMQRTHGPVVASAVIGAVWAIWHLPMLLLAGMKPLQISMMLPFFVAGSFVFTWLFNTRKAGLPAAVLAHMGAHLNNSHQALPDDSVPAVVHAAAFAAFAIALCAWDRELGYKTEG